MGGRRIRLLIFLLAIPAAAAALAQQAPSRRAFVSRAFPHKAHLKDGVDAECLVCHGAEAEAIGGADRTVTTFENCAKCHAREKSIDVTTAKKQERAAFSRFSHVAHRATSCAACHQWDRAKDVLSVPGDQSLCVKCHGTHDTAKDLFAGGGTCAQCHFETKIARVPAEEKGKFSHAHHLPRDRPPGREDCARCHAEAAASTDLRDGKLVGARAERCGSCHAGGPGAAPAAVARETAVVKRFFTEFSHAAHAKTFDCARCHELGKDDVMRFAGALPKYEGCVECHYHATARVQNHGQAYQCGRCHEGNGAAIRTVEVERRDLGAISFGAAVHPFIAAGDLPRESQACGTCHLRARDAIESRIAGKPFSHAQHLGAEAAAAAARGRFPVRERCLACHHALEHAATPAASKAFDLAKDCAACHRGEPARVEGATRTARLPPFSHERHLASRNPRIAGCESCHDFDGAADRMQTPAEVLACTRCHDHKTKADVTGHDLDKCILCHSGESLFRQGVTVEVPNVRLAAAAFSRQAHDQSGKCAACHPPAGGFALERTTVVEVKHKNEPHVGLKLDSCKDCHVRPKGF